MNKLKFELIDNTVAWATQSDDKYTLLALFIGEYADLNHDILSPINNLKAILNGETTFDKIQDPTAWWSYGNGAGTFECDQETAWFDPDEEVTDAPRLEMPLSEVIYWLTEWKAFLEFGK